MRRRRHKTYQLSCDAKSTSQSPLITANSQVRPSAPRSSGRIALIPSKFDEIHIWAESENLDRLSLRRVLVSEAGEFRRTGGGHTKRDTDDDDCLSYALLRQGERPDDGDRKNLRNADILLPDYTKTVNVSNIGENFNIQLLLKLNEETTNVRGEGPREEYGDCSWHLFSKVIDYWAAEITDHLT